MMLNFAQVPLTSLFHDISLSECGDTKGCVLYPRHCTGHDCLAAVTYTYSQVNDNFRFEMLSSANHNYISLALSADEVMVIVVSIFRHSIAEKL